jgi:hypothetical protein
MTADGCPQRSQQVGQTSHKRVCLSVFFAVFMAFCI